MKWSIIPAILALVLFPRFHADAATCVATKTIKVKEVCGEVAGPFKEPIARAEVHLLNGGPKRQLESSPMITETS